MTNIKLTINGTKVKAVVSGTLTSGMVGLPVSIQYDSSWDGLTKNLVCRNGPWYGPGKGEVRVILNVEDAATVAHEVMTAGTYLYLGVEGYNADGTLVIPTVWAECGKIESGANANADPSAKPTLPAWAQLQAQITQLKQDGVTREQIAAAVEAYLEENPVEIPEGTEFKLPVATAETLGGVRPAAKTEEMTQSVGVDENGALYTKPSEAGGSDYVLSVGGDELGGVKNGGNVVINTDGTMTAPESAISDEQVASSVSAWLDAHPEATTTVADGTITQEKLSNALVEKLKLEPNHHLTEESVPIYISAFQAWTASTASGTRCTQLFRTPQYVRVKNTSAVTVKFQACRLANESDMDSADFVEFKSNWRNRQWYPINLTLAAGEEKTFATFEYGRSGCEYMQMMFNVGGNYGVQDLFEVTAIYDDWRPVYQLPDDSGIYLEDLPMRWVYQGYASSTTTELWCVVPYYPDFTYSVRGGSMPSVAKNTVDAVYLLDDSIFNTYDLGMCHNTGDCGYIPLIRGFTAIQYDTSVNGGKDSAYNWTYHTTPPESDLTGVKWIAFCMGRMMQEAAGDLGLDYYTSLIQAINDGDERNKYVTRWPQQLPRKIFSQIVKMNPSYQDEGTRYRALIATGENPLVGSKWVLFGDSLTDNYGGKDYSSDYFASRIAREFGMVLDNRAKSGSNIYAGGSGNYTAVSGIVKLDEYLAEIEAGTTEQADYITVAFGTNTFKSELGVPEDTSETNTSVYGAAKYFIEKVREKVPNAVLGFVLSPRQNWGSADPNNVRDVDGARTAIKTVCDEYGVPYIDMSTQSGITVDMLSDGIHISNDQSQKLYYHAMRRFMMGL